MTSDEIVKAFENKKGELVLPRTPGLRGRAEVEATHDRPPGLRAARADRPDVLRARVLVGPQAPSGSTRYSPTRAGGPRALRRGDVRRCGTASTSAACTSATGWSCSSSVLRRRDPAAGGLRGRRAREVGSKEELELAAGADRPVHEATSTRAGTRTATASACSRSSARNGRAARSRRRRSRSERRHRISCPRSGRASSAPREETIEATTDEVAATASAGKRTSET